MNKKVIVIAAVVLLVCVCLALAGVIGLAALGGSDNPTQAPAATTAATTAPAATGAKLLDATFARKLADNQAPIDPTTEFKPTDTITLSLKFEGRPKTGIVKTKFMLADQLIAEAQVDFADANSGVIFSVGQVTYAGFFLTPSKPFPASDKYRADVFLNDKQIGSYNFKVAGATSAPGSKITTVALTSGHDDKFNPINPGTTFQPNQKVYLLARGDFVKGTNVKVHLYADGALMKDGYEGDFTKDEKDSAIAINFLPQGGWKPGKYDASLKLNDQEVWRGAFTISGSAAQAPGAFTFGQFKLYTHPQGYFTVSQPAAWNVADRTKSSEGVIIVFDESGNRGTVIIHLTDAKAATSADDLVQAVSGYAKLYYGKTDSFNLLRAAAQSNTSAAAGYSFKIAINGALTEMAGVTSVERQDNRVAFLTLIVPISATKDKAIADGIGTISGSFKMNSKLALPK